MADEGSVFHAEALGRTRFEADFAKAKEQKVIFLQKSGQKICIYQKLYVILQFRKSRGGKEIDGCVMG